MLHRISLMAAVVIAALAISVTPALAGEDDGDPATPPVTTTPAPAPAPAPPPAPTVEIPPRIEHELDRLKDEVRDLKREAAKGGGGGGGGGNSGAGNTTASTAPITTPVAQKTFTVPQGGVQAGAGGTAQDGSGSLLPIGLGLIGLTLAGAVSGVALRRRYVTE
jgi:hypothetical protein